MNAVPGQKHARKWPAEGHFWGAGIVPTDNHPPPEFVEPPVALSTLPGLLTTVLMDGIPWRSCTT